MSLIGTEVKPFSAQAYHNGNFIEVTEADFKGKWSVVCFYPADFTFVCPTELEDLQNNYKAWHDTSDAIGKITYIMIGDPSHTLSRHFEVLIEEKGLADRGTFIIDPDGIVQAIEINAGGIGRDASILINKIKAAQYVRNNPKEVCPAKWKEGAETLKPSLDLVGKI